MDPRAWWKAADTPDRQGMAEIRHIEGLYAFWDGLLQRHPGLMIDNCASGGPADRPGDDWPGDAFLADRRAARPGRPPGPYVRPPGLGAVERDESGS